MPELPTRNSRAPDSAVDDRLVQDEGEPGGILAVQQISALGPELDKGGHALSRGLLIVESLQDGRRVIFYLKDPGTNIVSNWLTADAADS